MGSGEPTLANSRRRRPPPSSLGAVQHPGPVGEAPYRPSLLLSCNSYLGWFVVSWPVGIGGAASDLDLGVAGSDPKTIRWKVFRSRFAATRHASASRREAPRRPSRPCARTRNRERHHRAERPDVAERLFALVRITQPSFERESTIAVCEHRRGLPPTSTASSPATPVAPIALERPPATRNREPSGCAGRTRRRTWTATGGGDGDRL
jgi:hypothetical protein